MKEPSEETLMQEAELAAKIHGLGPDDAIIHGSAVEVHAAQPSVQQAVVDWTEEMFKPELQNIADKLDDEFTEFREELYVYLTPHAQVDSYGQPIAKEDIAELIAKESADVMFMLLQIAGKLGFDLLEETAAKLAINKARKWQRQPNGTYQHVPE